MNRTTTENTILIVALLGVMVAGQPMAAWSAGRYIGSGDYNDFFFVTGTNGWEFPGLPGPADTIRFANNIVTLTNLAPNVFGFQIGVDESAQLVVCSGGSLTVIGTFANTVGKGYTVGVTGRLTVYTNGVVNSKAVLEVGASANGILTIDGGTMNCSNHLWVGSGSVTGVIGIINITNSGFLNMLGVGGMIGLGTINASSASGETGFVNVSAGGVLNLVTIDPNGNSIQPGSVLDISGSGVVTIPNDRTTVMSNYVAAGKITANRGAGTVAYGFDSSANKTILQAAPPRQAITGTAVSSGNVTLTCQTTAGHFYHLESTPGLSPATWTPVSGSRTNATGTSVTFTFPTSGNQKFFRTVSP